MSLAGTHPKKLPILLTPPGMADNSESYKDFGSVRGSQNFDHIQTIRGQCLSA